MWPCFRRIRVRKKARLSSKTKFARQYGIRHPGVKPALIIMNGGLVRKKNADEGGCSLPGTGCDGTVRTVLVPGTGTSE